MSDWSSGNRFQRLPVCRYPLIAADHAAESATATLLRVPPLTVAHLIYLYNALPLVPNEWRKTLTASICEIQRGGHALQYYVKYRGKYKEQPINKINKQLNLTVECDTIVLGGK